MQRNGLITADGDVLAGAMAKGKSRPMVDLLHDPQSMQSRRIIRMTANFMIDRQYPFTDPLRDLRHYGVSESPVTLQSPGNGISASVKFGWIRHPCSRTSSCTFKVIDCL